MRSWCCLLGLLLVSSCDRAPPEPPRGKLEGQVTLNGKPVAKGTIRFMALDPSGFNVVADIANGRYAVPEGKGPSKGKYRVEISVPSEKKNRFENPDIPGQRMEEPVELLPPKYHRNSEIFAEYDPGSGKSYNFQLSVP